MQASAVGVGSLEVLGELATVGLDVGTILGCFATFDLLFALGFGNELVELVLTFGGINMYAFEATRAAGGEEGQYLGENEGTVCVASGGQGRHEDISEAQAALNVLTEQYGIDADRIVLEEKSTDTEENLSYSLEIIGDSGASVGIVTNGFHELRAMSIARKTGYENVYSVPAQTLFPVGIHYCVREFFGMVEVWLKY